MEAPIIDIHTHNATSGDISIVSFRAGVENIDRNIRYSAAVHPWDAERVVNFDLHSVISPKLAAIGECGLDYAMTNPSNNAQKIWFEASLDIASQLHKPVIIHCVKAYNDLTDILKCYDIDVIIHGFNGHRQLAEQLINRGYYLSFGAGLFESPKTQESLRYTPLNRIFLETDTGDTPIYSIYERTASIIGCEMSSLTENIFSNYKQLFE